jgi:hypothetical protein
VVTIQFPLRVSRWNTSFPYLPLFLKDYLIRRIICSKHGYERAAVVLAGAALEEGLKNRARAAGVEVTSKETLSPIIIKLKAMEVGVLTEFEAKRLEAVAKMRNDAAHGGGWRVYLPLRADF